MSGHIRRRGEQSWETKIRSLAPDPLTGKRTIRYQSFKGTKREAQAKLTELLSEHARGVLVDASKETLGEFMSLAGITDWASHNVSLKTAERYRQLIVNQIRPHLGTMPVQRIKPGSPQFTVCQVAAIRWHRWRTTGYAYGRACPPLVAKDIRARGTVGCYRNNPASLVHPPKVAQPRSRSSAKTRSRSYLMHCVAVTCRSTRLQRLHWLPVCDAVNYWRCAGRMSTLTAASCASSSRWSRPGQGCASSQPKTKHGRRSHQHPASGGCRSARTLEGDAGAAPGVRSWSERAE